MLAATLPADLESDPSLPRHERLPHDEERAIGELQQYWRERGFVDGGVVEAAVRGRDRGRSDRDPNTGSGCLHDPAPRGYGVVAGRGGVGSGPWPGDASAVLQLAFAGLGAHFAVSSAWHDNHASLGVSRSLGYVENGIDLHVRDDRVDRLQRMILAVERWRAVALPDVRVVGLDECLPAFRAGLSPGSRRAATKLARQRHKDPPRMPRPNNQACSWVGNHSLTGVCGLCRRGSWRV